MSPRFWWNTARGVHKADEPRLLAGRMNPLGRSRIFFECLRRADGALDEVAAAVGACVVERALDTPPAKSTFKGTDHRVG
jgi:hypothetical protein